MSSQTRFRKLLNGTGVSLLRAGSSVSTHLIQPEALRTLGAELEPRLYVNHPLDLHQRVEPPMEHLPWSFLKKAEAGYSALAVSILNHFSKFGVSY